MSRDLNIHRRLLINHHGLFKLSSTLHVEETRNSTGTVAASWARFMYLVRRSFRRRRYSVFRPLRRRCRSSYLSYEGAAWTQGAPFRPDTVSMSSQPLKSRSTCNATGFRGKKWAYQHGKYFHGTSQLPDEQVVRTGRRWSWLYYFVQKLFMQVLRILWVIFSEQYSK